MILSVVAVCCDGVDELAAGFAQASGQLVTIGVVHPPVEASSKDRHPDVREG